MQLQTKRKLYVDSNMIHLINALSWAITTSFVSSTNSVDVFPYSRWRRQPRALPLNLLITNGGSNVFDNKPTGDNGKCPQCKVEVNASNRSDDPHAVQSVLITVSHKVSCMKQIGIH